jgi:microcystin-dependent protein
MAFPFVAEIRIFPFSFAPAGWAFCDGQLLPTAQNDALFMLLGTTYGGDGTMNFALPDMQGSAPMHPGQGPVSLHSLGETGGSDTVTLLDSEMPAHSHALAAATNPSLVKLPAPNLAMARSRNGNAYQDTPGNQVAMNSNAIGPAGGGLPHNNMQPYLTLNFCIALQGVMPPRS